MEPEKGNDQEVEGVLNPGAVRGKDGELYLFPRLVAKGNYSRIGIARVIFNKDNDPIDIERLGIALEPQESHEMRPDGGGCEDAAPWERLKIGAGTPPVLTKRGWLILYHGN
jgi:predicted GH43/DUF377 family glycosyl hydrolase